MIDTSLLIANSSEIYGHFFENESQGVPRAVYWNVGVQFEELVTDSDEWVSSLLWEWVEWPIRRWQDLDGCKARLSASGQNGEASLYLFAQHQPIREAELSIARLNARLFEITIRARLDLIDLEGEVHPNFSLEARTESSFDGIVVVPDSLSPSLNDESSLLESLALFTDITAYEEPQWDHFRWVLPPKVGGNAV